MSKSLSQQIEHWRSESKKLSEQEQKIKNQNYQTKLKNYNLQRNYQRIISKH